MRTCSMRYPALRRAGLRKIRFHDLRHTYASLLIANDEPPEAHPGAHRHSSINVTMDVYGHLMPGGGGEVADRLGELVFRVGGRIPVEHDALQLADDAQAIVSIGGLSFDKRIEPSLILIADLQKHGRRS